MLRPSLLAAVFAVAASLAAQTPQTPVTGAGEKTESLPVLDASVILQPQYFQGPHFLVRRSVPTVAGCNRFTIDSDFGTFEADGNLMLMRRVAEINAIASLRAMSQSDEFKNALKQAAKTPVKVVENLVEDPGKTLIAVPKGIVGFLKRTGSSVKSVASGHKNSEVEGNAIENISGYSKVKRELALQLGVDPYTTNLVVQDELAKVARPAFAGKFTANLALSVVTVVSAVNTAGKLTDALREKSASELRSMNLDILDKRLGIAKKVALAFVNNNAISPTSQTIIVDALAQMGNIPGQGEFVRNAAASQDEHDALAFQQCAELMLVLQNRSQIARITHLGGMTVCQTTDGTLVLPIQWDYAAWTPLASRFVAELQAQKMAQPVTGQAIIITGDVSPLVLQAITARGMSITTRALPGPLQ